MAKLPPDLPPTPPPVPRKKKAKAPVRGRTQEQTPELVEAKARTKAAKLCSSSLYAAIAGVVLAIVPFFRGASWLGAGAAIVTGVIGLVQLSRVGMGPPLGPDLAPLERVSVRMAMRAKPQAIIGVVLGVLLLGIYTFSILAAQQEAEERRDEWREMLDSLEELRNVDVRGEDLTYDDQPAEVETAEEMAMNALDAVGVHMARPGYEPENPLPEDEVARRLKTVLENYPDSEAAREVVAARHEPYITMKRILEAHGWKPPPADD